MRVQVGGLREVDLRGGFPQPRGGHVGVSRLLQGEAIWVIMFLPMGFGGNGCFGLVVDSSGGTGMVVVL